MLLFCDLALLTTSASVVLSVDGSTIVPSATGLANAIFKSTGFRITSMPIRKLGFSYI